MLSWLSRLCTLAALALLSAWLVGRVVSDRWVWSQYAAWLPAVIAVPLAWVLVLGSIGAAWLSRARQRRTGIDPVRAGRLGARISRLGRRGAMAMLLAASVYTATVEWRWHSLVLSARRGAAAPSPERSLPGLRVAFWNAWATPRNALGPALSGLNADVMLVSNAPWGGASGLVRGALAPVGPAAGGEFNSAGTSAAGETERGDDKAWTVDAGWFVVAARVPIRRWAVATLGLPTADEQDGVSPAQLEERGQKPARADPGRAMLVEIDTSAALGRPIVIWVIDLPSDSRLSRWAVAARAAETLRAWRGLAYKPQPGGGDGDGGGPAEVEPIGPGFPTPDLVVGDFNIPRGSASLRLLTPGLHDAFNDAGAGPAATWPRRWPLWAIDQAFLAPTLEAREFRVLDRGVGTHRMVEIEIEPAAAVNPRSP